ncbi:hypothetical protein DL766_007903 [Monosporascus sp. MC13-8B]|uniref:Methyltransferase domain-containing protein n=1 Tax=Monosporascus cannonballus TaxID=155416 RepID=A0ABY0H466_9PEZI|nr:hypothetical protein DL762_005681 [Monosporascus cannonballus]RYO89445.1 hypothetical protein DL763_005658 [Monosporascus cannonballus]RYP21597.1 hypothetical protein DL766_007903 [Monosporascus sp. MC13-8B]
MSVDSDAHFWDKSAKSYAKSAVSDDAGYQRTLDRTRSVLKPTDRVLELGCGTGTTALCLADGVQSYLATDISSEMIKIAHDKLAASHLESLGSGLPPRLSFRTATAELLTNESARFTAVLGFNYLHLVRDLPGTLRSLQSLLEDGGFFITKTPCVGDMNVLLRLALPVMRAVGRAPYVSVFQQAELGEQIRAAGFDILETEMHASKGNDNRPYIIACKK